MVQGLFFEDLSLGQSAQMAKIVTAADIEAFAAVSGDINPVHLDEAYARTTPFQGRIAHGMLSGAYISALDERRGHVTFVTLCQVDGKTVVEGEAVIMTPRRTPAEGR